MGGLRMAVVGGISVGKILGILVLHRRTQQIWPQQQARLNLRCESSKLIGVVFQVNFSNNDPSSGQQAFPPFATAERAVEAACVALAVGVHLFRVPVYLRVHALDDACIDLHPGLQFPATPTMVVLVVSSEVVSSEFLILSVESE